MAVIDRRTRQASAGPPRYGTFGKQQQHLNFLEEYSSDDSFSVQGAQPHHSRYGTYSGGAIKFQTKERPYGTYSGEQIEFGEKKYPHGTYTGGRIVFQEYAEAAEGLFKRLVHGGRAYAAVLILAWLVMHFLTSLPFRARILISIGLLFPTLPILNIMKAYEIRRTKVSSHDENALYRRPSGPREPMPGTLNPTLRFADLFKVKNYGIHPSARAARAGYREDAAGIPPGWQARRLWSEAIDEYRPHFRRLLTKIANQFGYLALQFLYFHLALQLLVTVANVLGVHFHEGKDTIAFFTRYWINITSLENMFGATGARALTSYARIIASFIARWIPGWIFGLRDHITWQLPIITAQKAWGLVKWIVGGVYSLPGKLLAKDDMGERVAEVFGNAKVAVRDTLNQEPAWIYKDIPCESTGWFYGNRGCQTMVQEWPTEAPTRGTVTWYGRPRGIITRRDD